MRIARNDSGTSTTPSSAITDARPQPAGIQRVTNHEPRAVEEIQDEKHEQLAVAPLPPHTPGSLGPDGAGDEDTSTEHHAHVDTNVAPHVERFVALEDVQQCIPRTNEKSEIGSERHRHMKVEDLLGEVVLGAASF